MTLSTSEPFSEATILWKDVFLKADDDRQYMALREWDMPVQYFVGRNGSGKSRAAAALGKKLGAHILSTDRLVGLMSFSTYGFGSVPTEYKGVPLGEDDRKLMQQIMGTSSSFIAADELYVLREQPDIWLRVAAFLRRALGRVVELRESAGFLDPYVTIQGSAYSLLRDEGHGLRELVLLLAGTYRHDWSYLIVDEPELHLHPSMARLWLTELNRECLSSGRRAIIVTHEPSLLKPTAVDDLKAVWIFTAGDVPVRLYDSVLEPQRNRVTSSLREHPELVSQIVFSPRPVLVEGIHDTAALTVTMARMQPPEVIAQTDLVECGGSGAVGLWFEICHRLRLDVKAIADLDALFDSGVQRAVDSLPEVKAAISSECSIEPARTAEALRQLIQHADKQHIASDPASRAEWLAAADFSELPGFDKRRQVLIDIWKNAGIWLHPQGTLEKVLGIEQKGPVQAGDAAARVGPIDQVAAWSAYKLDLDGDVEFLLNLEVEQIAHSIMSAQRGSNTVEFSEPVGPRADAQSRLVDVVPIGRGSHRIIVKMPRAFIGYWLEFSRDTPSSHLTLKPPGDDPT